MPGSDLNTTAERFANATIEFAGAWNGWDGKGRRIYTLKRQKMPRSMANTPGSLSQIRNTIIIWNLAYLEFGTKTTLEALIPGGGSTSRLRKRV